MEPCCKTCQNCTWVHEYEIYFCTTRGEPIFGSLNYGLCGMYEEKEEE